VACQQPKCHILRSTLGVLPRLAGVAWRDVTRRATRWCTQPYTTESGERDGGERGRRMSCRRSEEASSDDDEEPESEEAAAEVEEDDRSVGFAAQPRGSGFAVAASWWVAMALWEGLVSTILSSTAK